MKAIGTVLPVASVAVAVVATAVKVGVAVTAEIGHLKSCATYNCRLC